MLIQGKKAFFSKDDNGIGYPRIQILTIENLLTKGKRPEYYDMSCGDLTFRRAKKTIIAEHEQPSLF